MQKADVPVAPPPSAIETRYRLIQTPPTQKRQVRETGQERKAPKRTHCPAGQTHRVGHQATVAVGPPPWPDHDRCLAAHAHLTARMASGTQATLAEAVTVGCCRLRRANSPPPRRRLLPMQPASTVQQPAAATRTGHPVHRMADGRPQRQRPWRQQQRRRSSEIAWTEATSTTARPPLASDRP